MGWSEPIKSLIGSLGRLREALPEVLSRRLRGGRYRYTAEDIPPPPVVHYGECRLFIAPANYAGQGYLWARAAESLPGVSAVNMQISDRDQFGFPSDHTVPFPVAGYSRRWRQELFSAVVTGFTHVVVEAALPLFGNHFGRDPAAEIRALRERGIEVAMLSHGTDLRLPSRHRELDEWSPFHGMGAELAARLEHNALRFRRLLIETKAPLFVSTPDLLLDWPKATWLPVVVSPEVWAIQNEPLMRKRPVVVHAPTNAVIKGSDLIDPVMWKLHQEGVIEYRRISGVAAAEMPELYKTADVVLEQFRIGTYSVSAVEAMAAGRVVIGHVHDQVRDHVRSTYDRDVPVVEATVSSLENVVRDVVADSDSYREVASKGPQFVNAVHDGSASATVLHSFFRRR